MLSNTDHKNQDGAIDVNDAATQASAVPPRHPAAGAAGGHQNTKRRRDSDDDDGTGKLVVFQIYFHDRSGCKLSILRLNAKT